MLSAVRGSNWRQLQVNFLLLFLSVTVSGINVSAGLRAMWACTYSAVLWVKSVCSYRVTLILYRTCLLNGFWEVKRRGGFDKDVNAWHVYFFYQSSERLALNLNFILTFCGEFRVQYWSLARAKSGDDAIWKEKRRRRRRRIVKSEREEIKQSPILDRRRRGGEKREGPKPDAKSRFFSTIHRGRSAQVGV